jgi:hypothetical protein
VRGYPDELAKRHAESDSLGQLSDAPSFFKVQDFPDGLNDRRIAIRFEEFD